MRLLLDEHFSLTLLNAILAIDDEVQVESLHRWHGGAFLRCPDDRIVEAASKEGLTLVTFDVTTIPPILQNLAIENTSHGGVIFIPSRRIAQNDYGQLASRLVSFWRVYGKQEWRDRVAFLPPA